MDNLKLIHISEIPQASFMELMANPRVARYMPLLERGFTDDDYIAFVNAKQRLWDENGYGPWAFVIHGRFAGWGGLQSENGDPDFALVLHPDFWGWGVRIFKKIRDEAFHDLGLDYMTALLPPDRLNKRAIERLGFKPDGEREIDGRVFLRFRLDKA